MQATGSGSKYPNIRQHPAHALHLPMPTCQKEPAPVYRPTNMPKLKLRATKKHESNGIKPQPQTHSVFIPLSSTLFTTFLSEESFEERDFQHRSESNTGLVFMWQNDSPSFPAASEAICALPAQWNPSLQPGRVEHSRRAAAPLRFSLNYCNSLEVFVGFF